jgi:hypothetical protein
MIVVFMSFQSGNHLDKTVCQQMTFSFDDRNSPTRVRLIDFQLSKCLGCAGLSMKECEFGDGNAGTTYPGDRLR